MTSNNPALPAFRPGKDGGCKTGFQTLARCSRYFFRSIRRGDCDCRGAPLFKSTNDSTFVRTGRLKVAELFFEVPVDYSRPNEARLRLFARAFYRKSTSIENNTGERQLPWLVYLQGGPGMSCAKPQELNWAALMIDKGYQVLQWPPLGLTGFAAFNYATRSCSSTNVELA